MSKRVVQATSYGMITAFILILIVALIFATLFRFTALDEFSIGQLPLLIISFCALFIGGLISGAKLKEKGLMIGAITGLTYSLFIYLILFLGYDRHLGLDQYLTILVNVIVTGMGGILGVNLFGRK
ncbi:putative membrane protein (TIGR04086 family) [Pullulanibacillus pueri]|uniref:Membrane protein n=1 Tax=Pullulanibacillus pueri TaxID=1437324 RepID=A0A8J3EMU2_9BACL|nr:TIGR04086 family membrane protein [Pullulanibacillus pueri]MBM7683270.1 putative membrane protein (TIGR04086 family) [Pullulanibacillus pueri]GGH85787.1 membrane protein [Pullulanibacillus pueri]